ncbi:Hypothetical predicted protein, partial [Mytilus galloprovincialis]
DNLEIRRTQLVTQLTATFHEYEQNTNLSFKNLFFIDARNKDDNEIDKLKHELVQAAFSQTSWGQKMPLIWVPLEKQIVDLKLRGTTILRIEEIQKLNKSNEDLMMDDKKLHFFLRTQHAIGKVIFFDQDELAKFVIIEPSVLVNALRSFVTDEMFFPKNDTECYNILKKMQLEGILKKNDLLKLWNQDEFKSVFQNQDYKDFIAKILLRLDVLVEPTQVNHDVNISPDYYIVPCMIQTRLDNDYAEKYLNRNKSICMAYVFKVQMVPPCVFFRLIASAVGIWPFKEYQERKMFFQDIATFVFDENNEFSLIMDGRKIVVYFTNANSIQKIKQPKVASVQECLSMAIKSITEFYQIHSGSSYAFDVIMFEKAFELEYGAACKTPCFAKREEELRLSKVGMWKCKHGQSHEADYLWYWDSKKNQTKTPIKMTDISPIVLMEKPSADLLRKLSFAVGIDGARLGLNLGVESSVIENMVISNKYNIFEKTLKILDYWKKLDDSVTVKHLVEGLQTIGGRGLETIVEYYSLSNRSIRQGPIKSVPLSLLTQDGITEDKGSNLLFKHEVLCDGLFVDCIVDKRMNLRVNTDTDDCQNRLVECESLYNRHLLLKTRVDNRYYQLNKVKEELIDAIQHKDSLLLRHILAYWNLFNSDISFLKQMIELSIKTQCACCAKAIAWKITRLFMKEVTVSEYCDIWPGFRCACKKEYVLHGGESFKFCSSDVVIIVEVNEIETNLIQENSFHGIPVKYEKQIGQSQEGKLITEKITRLQSEDSELVSRGKGIESSEAKRYFAQHRKLSVISSSPLQSRGYPSKQDFIEEPCIQLYCRLKGYIPVGEAHFPSRIDGIPTDILQGYAELLVEDIRIGSEVGTVTGRTGTLGGFVRYHGKDAFLTCAHVIIDWEYLVTKGKRYRVHENKLHVSYINQGSAPGTTSKLCGELASFAFAPDKSDGTTVDAAIIQLDDTMVKLDHQNSAPWPVTGLGMSSLYLNECCVDYKFVGTLIALQTRSCGLISGLQHVIDNIVIESERKLELKTLMECVTGMEIRNPKPHNISEKVHFKEIIKKVADEEKKSPSSFTFYNQISFSNVPFQQGDSGTCIYAVGPHGIYGCIGMAIATHPDGGCIVTPIKPILSAFRIL